MITSLMTDVRQAARAAARTPVVAVASLLTISLGIGATTAIFSVANAMLLRPLPVRDPDRLVTVSSDTALQFGFRGGTGWSYAMWDAFRSRQAAFDGAFAWTAQTIDLAATGEMQPAQVIFASGDFFNMLGVTPILGRVFDTRDDVRGGGPEGPVAVIGFDAWQQRFQGAADITGRHISIGGVPVRIAGVAPPGFFGVDTGQRFDFVVPLAVEPLVRGSQSIVASPRAFILTVMLRLREDQSIEQGTAAMRTAQRDVLAALPDTPLFVQDPVVLVPAATGLSDRSRLRNQYERPIVIVGVIAACVLVVGCLNLANLLLARAAAVRGEIGLRLALGAARWRVARHLIVEGGLLVGLGAALGLLTAAWGSRSLVAFLPAAAPVHLDLSIDWRVAVFATGAAVLTLALCGVLPVLLALRASPRDVMGRAASRGQSAPATLAGILVVTQVAMSAVLLIAAGDFVATAIGLARVPLGFDADRLLVVTVDARQTATPPAQQPALFDRIVQGLSTLPGITQAAGSIWTPIGGGGGGLMTDARGRQHLPAGRSAFNFITPGWFAAYGTSLVAGRDFAATDGAGAPRVAIVNEAFVRQQFDRDPPLGRLTDAGPCGSETCTIVGVVGDARSGTSPRDPLPPTIYFPLAQSAGLAPPGNTRVRATLRLAAAVSMVEATSIAAALRQVDARLTFQTRPLSADVRASFAQERLVALLAVIFGVLALLLAGLGIYGVTGYGVARRRTELAIRLALGAAPEAVVALIVRQAVMRLAAGVAIGLVVAFWLSRYITALLFGVEPLAPSVVAAVVAVLAAVGSAAAWGPVRQAARVEPADLLRAEM